MKVSFFLIFHLWVLVSFAQQYLFGDFQRRYQLEKAIFLNDEIHGLSKPILLDSSLENSIQEGIWSYGNFIDNSRFLVLPIVDGIFKYNSIDNSFSNAIGLGAQFNYEHKNFYTQWRAGFQMGTLSTFEHDLTHKRPYAPGIGYLNDSVNLSYRSPIVEGYISYQPHPFINLSTGIGKNFLGDGYRSLFLSDYASNYPFLKMESTFWKVKYINLWSLHHDLHTATYTNQKWSSLHALSYNVTKWLNLTLFEAVVWQGEDTLNKRGFDFNYLNPFVFFRPVEYGIGSSDNSFFGGGIKIKLPKKVLLYQHFILDEFLLSEFQNRNGWWGNKYGYQVGFRTFDLFGIDGLYSLAEWNFVRPFTYSHMTSMQNYGHQNQSLAHPLEANFFEGLAILGYQNNNLDLYIKYAFQRYGKDFQLFNFGGNMFNSYVVRDSDYGHVVGQGNTINQHVFELRASLLLIAMTNTKLFTQFNYRYNRAMNNSISSSTLISLGISSNLWQSYMDY